MSQEFQPPETQENALIPAEKAKRHNHTADEFPPETWDIIRKAFESGLYQSVHSMQLELRQNLSPCPGVRLIQEVAFDRCWDWGRMDEIIEEKKQRDVSEILSEMGMDKAKRLEYLIRGIKASDSILEMIETIKERLNEHKMTVADNAQFLLTLKALEETNFKGMKVMLDALKLAGEWAGDNAAVKVKQLGSTAPRNSSLQLVEDMTDEELSAEYERMKKAGVIDLIERQEEQKQIGQAGTTAKIDSQE